MVWHHMSFQYLYSLVLAQSSDYFLQVCSILIVYDLPSVFRNEHYVVLAHPFRMCQTACLVCHKISFHCSNRLDILFYHVWRFFGITFVTHPHSGWLSVSHFVLNLPKGTTKIVRVPNFGTRTIFLYSCHSRVVRSPDNGGSDGGGNPRIKRGGDDVLFA